MTMKTDMRHFVILPLLILCLSGCGKSSETESTESSSSELTSEHLILGNGSEPRTLDKDAVTDSTGTAIMDALFDPLVAYDPETKQYEPVACERWEVSEDGLVYTFHLLKDARWSNGDPVVAADWEAGFQRALRPEISTPYMQVFTGIINALEYNSGEAEWADVGIKTDGEHKLVVTFQTPKLSFIGRLSQSCFFPFHRPSAGPFGAETSLDTAYYRSTELVGNGAFKLEKWVQDEVVIVARNPYYVFGDEIHLEKISYLPIGSLDTELRAFDTNKLHRTNSVPPQKLNLFRTERTDVLREDDLFGTYFFNLNVERPPLDDPRVRRALALTVDRYEITNFVTNGGQPSATSFIPDGLAGYTGATGYEENIEEAQRLLAEAGFPGGEGFPQLTLIYNTLESHRSIAQAVQEMWRTHLGIEIALLNQEWKVFLQTIQDGDYDISRSGWVGGTDPEGYLDLFNSESGNNRSNYSNPAFDALFLEASQQIDPQRRMELFREAEAIIVRDMPVIPIYHYLEFYLLRPEVQNWRNNPAMDLIFNGVMIGDSVD